MFRSLLFIFSMFCLAGCTPNKSFLEKYYTDNPGLHNELRDSLVSFCKQHDTKVYLKKYTVSSDETYFSIFFDDIPGYTPVVYNSSLQRHDHDSVRTAKVIVPKGLIENFNSSVYRFITCENGQVFFGYKEDGQQIFAREVYYIGILTPSVVEVSKKQKRISPDAIITTHYVP